MTEEINTAAASEEELSQEELNSLKKIRMDKLDAMKAAGKNPFEITKFDFNITAADLPEIDLTKAGLKGSPTKVKKTFVPQKKTGGMKIQEEDNAASAKKLFEVLSGAAII